MKLVYQNFDKNFFFLNLIIHRDREMIMKENKEIKEKGYIYYFLL